MGKQDECSKDLQIQKEEVEKNAGMVNQDLGQLDGRTLRGSSLQIRWLIYSKAAAAIRLRHCLTMACVVES
jgi:hypothetical protein